VSIVTADEYKKLNLYDPHQASLAQTSVKTDLISVCKEEEEDLMSNRLASLLRQNHFYKKEKSEIKFKLDRQMQSNIALARENETLRESLEGYQERVTGQELEALRIVRRMLSGVSVQGLAHGLKLVEEMAQAREEELEAEREKVRECEAQIEMLQAKQYDTCIDLVKKNNALEAEANALQ